MLTCCCKAALEDGRPLRALDLQGDDLKRLRGFQFLSAKPLLIVINLDESQLADGGEASATRPREAAGPDHVSVARGRRRAVAVCAKIELEIAQLDRADAAAFLADLGPDGIGTRPRDSRQLRPARLHVVLHRRRGRVPRLVDPAQHARRSSPPARSTATSRAASSAPRSSSYDHADRRADRWRRAAITARCGSKARNTSCRTATSSTSDSPHDRACRWQCARWLMA